MFRTQRPSAFEDNLTMWSPSYCPPEKALLSLSVWSRSEYIWKLNWKKSLQTENYQGVPCSQRQSSKKMMSIFLIVIITPMSDRYFRGKIYSCPHQKGLSFHFIWSLIGRKGLLHTALFWKLPENSVFPHRQSRQRLLNTLLMININLYVQEKNLCCLLILIYVTKTTEIWFVSPSRR